MQTRLTQEFDAGFEKRSLFPNLRKQKKKKLNNDE